MAFKILLASDGSSGSIYAAEWLDQHAEQIPMQVTILTVAVASVGLGQAAYVVEPDVHDQLVNAVLNEAEDAARRTQSVMTHLNPLWITRTSTNVVQTILDVADEYTVDFVVVGRRGYGTWSSAILGSVSLRLLTHSSRPIWVIPPAPEVRS